MTTTSPAALAAGHWTVDAARSTATFRVGNLGKEATGTVPVIEGVIDVGADGLPVAISGTLDLSAIDTGIPRRDKDLRQRRFLDLDQHPVMSFTSGPAAATPAPSANGGRLPDEAAAAPPRGGAGLAEVGADAGDWETSWAIAVPQRSPPRSPPGSTVTACARGPGRRRRGSSPRPAGRRRRLATAGLAPARGWPAPGR
jgi:hypothetical protein